nr:hypothetical protein BaRGS_004434 [Batillaria attramentaria]
MVAESFAELKEPPADISKDAEIGVQEECAEHKSQELGTQPSNGIPCEMLETSSVVVEHQDVEWHTAERLPAEEPVLQEAEALSENEDTVMEHASTSPRSSHGRFCRADSSGQPRPDFLDPHVLLGAQIERRRDPSPSSEDRRDLLIQSKAGIHRQEGGGTVLAEAEAITAKVEETSDAVPENTDSIPEQKTDAEPDFTDRLQEDFAGADLDHNIDIIQLYDGTMKDRTDNFQKEPRSAEMHDNVDTMQQDLNHSGLVSNTEGIGQERETHDNESQQSPTQDTKKEQESDRPQTTDTAPPKLARAKMETRVNATPTSPMATVLDISEPATSHDEEKEKSKSKSRLRKYWPFRRKKGRSSEEKKKRKNSKEKDDSGREKKRESEARSSSPDIPPTVPLRQSTPTPDDHVSDSNASHASAGPGSETDKNEKQDKSKDSDSSTLSESSKNAKDSADADKAKDETVQKDATPTPEKKSKKGKDTEEIKKAEKPHDTSTSSSSSSSSSKGAYVLTPDSPRQEEIHERRIEPALTPPRLATPLREQGPSYTHHQQTELQHRFDGEFQRMDDDITAEATSPATASPAHDDIHFSSKRAVVVVAVDLGTTHSGYAFSFTRDPSSVYVMSRWAGQEPGLLNHKTLSALLLTPDARFHSFGLAARNHYHNLLPIEARHWLYFERFKMTLHHCKDLSRDTMVTAANGKQLPVLTVFAHVLEFFATHALEQLSDQSGTDFRRQDVRWVVTVPAIWREPAKQLMRQAANMAGMFSEDDPGQLLIVLEPEAASIYCRRLRMHQLVPEAGAARPFHSHRRSTLEVPSNTPAVNNLTVDGSRSTESLNSLGEGTLEDKVKGARYLVVDCGGGTVDITVHELSSNGQLVELHRATGGPHGSTGVDEEFEALLSAIFSREFIETYKRQFPVGWVNLLTDFESRKRAASPFKTTAFNVSLPFTFISEFRKHKGEMEQAVKRHGDPDVEWSLQGMLRLAPPAMRRLFAPTLISIRQAIGDVLNHPNTRDLRYLFLVGGFAESPMLQHEIRREFGHLVTVLIPQDVSLAVLRGAVLFGLDPKVVSVRCARLTYGVGILNRFDPARHPPDKRVRRDGVDWCTDVFDRFVDINQPVALGTCVTRRYTPARTGQQLIVLNVYSSVNPNPAFITDHGVRKCGTLCLDFRNAATATAGQHPEGEGTVGGEGEGEGQVMGDTSDQPREILTRMAFGDTEISVTALDVTSGREVKAAIDFLSG